MLNFRSRHDPARARALLDQAGWRLGPGGVREQGGRRLAFEVSLPVGCSSLLMPQVVRRNLAAIGVAMSLRGIEISQLFATLNGNGQGWDGIVPLWTITGFPDGSDFFSAQGAVNYGH